VAAAVAVAVRELGPEEVGVVGEVEAGVDRWDRVGWGVRRGGRGNWRLDEASIAWSRRCGSCCCCHEATLLGMICISVRERGDVQTWIMDLSDEVALYRERER